MKGGALGGIPGEPAVRRRRRGGRHSPQPRCPAWPQSKSWRQQSWSDSVFRQHTGIVPWSPHWGRAGATATSVQITKVLKKTNTSSFYLEVTESTE